MSSVSYIKLKEKMFVYRSFTIFICYNFPIMPITTDHASLPQHRKLLVLLGSLLALFVADAVITRFIVTHGLGREGNPLLGFWVTTDQFAWVKLAAGLFACLLLWDMHKRAGRPVLIITGVFVGIFALIVGWNVVVAVMGLGSI